MLFGPAALLVVVFVVAVVEVFTCRSMLLLRKCNERGVGLTEENGSNGENAGVVELTAFLFFRKHNRRIKYGFLFVQWRVDSKKSKSKSKRSNSSQTSAAPLWTRPFLITHSLSRFVSVSLLQHNIRKVYWCTFKPATREKCGGGINDAYASSPLVPV